MIRGTKTNSYGDKTQKGYLCRACYRNRVEKRSLILFISTIVFGILSVILFLVIPLYLLVAQVYDEESFTSVIETYVLWGALMAIFGLFMFLFRRRELINMKKVLESK
jgi:nitrate reductase gamma subunit